MGYLSGMACYMEVCYITVYLYRFLYIFIGLQAYALYRR